MITMKTKSISVFLMYRSLHNRLMSDLLDSCFCKTITCQRGFEFLITWYFGSPNPTSSTRSHLAGLISAFLSAGMILTYRKRAFGEWNYCCGSGVAVLKPNNLYLSQLYHGRVVLLWVLFSIRVLQPLYSWIIYV